MLILCRLMWEMLMVIDQCYHHGVGLQNPQYFIQQSGFMKKLKDINVADPKTNNDFFGDGWIPTFLVGHRGLPHWVYHIAGQINFENKHIYIYVCDNMYIYIYICIIMNSNASDGPWLTLFWSHPYSSKKVVTMTQQVGPSRDHHQFTGI